MAKIRKIYKIEKNKIVEYIVEPNHVLSGWSILLAPPDKDGYCSIYPISNEALKRSRFDSIKKAETYVGLENIIYYNGREEAEEVLELERRFKK